jgi:hypothetical protein
VLVKSPWFGAGIPRFDGETNHFSPTVGHSNSDGFLSLLVKYPIVSLHPHSQNSHKTYKINMFAA